MILLLCRIANWIGKRRRILNNCSTRRANKEKDNEDKVKSSKDETELLWDFEISTSMKQIHREEHSDVLTDKEVKEGTGGFSKLIKESILIDSDINFDEKNYSFQNLTNKDKYF